MKDTCACRGLVALGDCFLSGRGWSCAAWSAGGDRSEGGGARRLPMPSRRSLSPETTPGVFKSPPYSTPPPPQGEPGAWEGASRGKGSPRSLSLRYSRDFWGPRGGCAAERGMTVLRATMCMARAPTSPPSASEPSAGRVWLARLACSRRTLSACCGGGRSSRPSLLLAAGRPIRSSVAASLSPTGTGASSMALPSAARDPACQPSCGAGVAPWGC
mmetsp:Transcript_45307/g.110321  ORF Transcript_45307/g.110321 Transcript_45307/m.110321 type:complete len:216 (-) Transcript_45307:74-721(-)